MFDGIHYIIRCVGQHPLLLCGWWLNVGKLTVSQPCSGRTREPGTDTSQEGHNVQSHQTRLHTWPQEQRRQLLMSNCWSVPIEVLLTFVFSDKYRRGSAGVVKVYDNISWICPLAGHCSRPWWCCWSWWCWWWWCWWLVTRLLYNVWWLEEVAVYCVLCQCSYRLVATTDYRPTMQRITNEQNCD